MGTALMGEDPYNSLWFIMAVNIAAATEAGAIPGGTEEAAPAEDGFDFEGCHDQCPW